MGLVVAALVFSVIALLVRWARWLPRGTAAPSRASRIANRLFTLGAVATLLAPVVVFAYRYFITCVRRESRVDSWERACMVGRAFSAVGEVTSFVWLVMVVLTAGWLLFATWRYHWSVRPTVPKAEPPYR